MKPIILIFLLWHLVNTPLIAQQSMLPVNDDELVKSVVIELFDGYRAGDSTRVRDSFSPNATTQTAYFDKTGKSQLSPPSSFKKFVSYVGGGFEEVHDERIWDIEISVDNNLATVWTKYAFYLGGEFSHCGAENFLLIKKNNEWKIFHLVDTRQRKDCKIPDSIKNR